MTTLNQICDVLEGIANAHKQIKTYGEGDIWEPGASESIQFPLMWVTPQESTMAEKAINHKLSIVFADIVDSDKNNELEVLSDMNQVALDVIAQLNSPAYFDNWIVDIKQSRLTPFTEKFDESTSGYVLSIVLRVNYLSDRCAVPSTLVASPLTQPCPDVLVIDGDATDHFVGPGSSYRCKTLNELLGITDATVIYSGLQTATKLTGVIQVLSTNDLAVNLTSAQVTEFIQALLTSEIYNDLSASQIAQIIQLFTTAQLNANLTTDQIIAIIQALTAAQINSYLTDGQITGLNATNIAKLVQSQIQNLVNAQLLLFSTAQLQYILSNAMVAQFINDNLSQATRNKLNHIYTFQDGQMVSYANYDAGWFQSGRGTDFFTLPLNNPFGNTLRFTQADGSAAISNAYYIDHAIGYGWYNMGGASGSWMTWAAACAIYGTTISGYNDFRLPSRKELETLIYIGGTKTGTLNYTPVNISANNVWTSNTPSDDSTVAWYRANTGLVYVTAKTSSLQVNAMRIHYPI